MGKLEGCSGKCAEDARWEWEWWGPDLHSRRPFFFKWANAGTSLVNLLIDSFGRLFMDELQHNSFSS